MEFPGGMGMMVSAGWTDRETPVSGIDLWAEDLRVYLWRYSEPV